jgi:predicted signal transduction protein with EAL and GGDEF domain
MPDADLTQNPGFGERLCSVLTRRHTAANEVPGEVTVTVSMGAAVMPIHGNDPEQLLWCADLALLNAKHDRRGRFLLYDSSLELPHSSSSETR